VRDECDVADAHRFAVLQVAIRLHGREGDAVAVVDVVGAAAREDRGGFGIRRHAGAGRALECGERAGVVGMRVRMQQPADLVRCHADGASRARGACRRPAATPRRSAPRLAVCPISNRAQACVPMYQVWSAMRNGATGWRHSVVGFVSAGLRQQRFLVRIGGERRSAGEGEDRDGQAHWGTRGERSERGSMPNRAFLRKHVVPAKQGSRAIPASQE
jgi:hypothetical protein